MRKVKEKWEDGYPSVMKRWEGNWNVISPMFKLSAEVRKVIYTTCTAAGSHSTNFLAAKRKINAHKIKGALDMPLNLCYKWPKFHFLEKANTAVASE